MPITPVDTYTDTWSTGWSSFEPFVLGGQQYYLAYKIDSGQVAIDRVRADGSGVDSASQATWTTGWSTLMPFVLGGEPHSLAYKVDSGDVSFDRILPGAQGVETRWSNTWTTGWTTFMPVTIGGEPGYLAYKIGTGQVAIERIRSDAQGADTLYSGTWSPGWSSFVPFLLNGHTHYIAYNAASGVAAIDRILDDGTGVESVVVQQWTTGWTSFMPFLVNGDAHYLAHKSESGQVTIDRIRGDASGSDGMMSATWATDWTSFVPLTLDGNPGYLVYKIGSGAVAIGAFRQGAAANVYGPARAPARTGSLEGGRVFLDRLTSEGTDVIGGVEVPKNIARDQKFYEQLIAGNMPDFCRLWSEVAYNWTDAQGGTHTARVWITPDCLAVGSNDDWLRVTVTGYGAQRLASAWGCLLPTPKILLKAFFQSSTARLTAHPLRAWGTRGDHAGDGKHQGCNTAMRWAEDIIQGVIACNPSTPVPPAIPPMFEPALGAHGSPPACTLASRNPAGQILVGHKKEVVLPYHTRGMLTFWGFYDGNDPAHPTFRQSGNAAHPIGFTDYSQGARLVHPVMEIDGAQVNYADVLGDPVQFRAVHDPIAMVQYGPLTPEQKAYPEAP
jgi:hypothetical protein